MALFTTSNIAAHGGGVRQTSTDSGLGKKKSRTLEPNRNLHIIPEKPVSAPPDSGKAKKEQKNWLLRLPLGRKSSALPAGRGLLGDALAGTSADSHAPVVDDCFAGLDVSKRELAQAITVTFIEPPLVERDDVDHRESAAHRARLALALAAAVDPGGNAKSAMIATSTLDRLKGMDLAAFVKGEQTVPDDDRAAQEAAWRTAYVLATTTKGFETLVEVTSVADEDRIALKNFLETAHHLAKAMPDVSPAPGALLRAVSPPAARTLLGDALQADHMILSGERRESLADHSPLLAYASTAVRNCHYTDEKGSPLYRAMKRADKLPRWMEAAVKRHNQRDRLGKIPLVGNLIAPLKKKSPLTALFDAGAQHLGEGGLSAARAVPQALHQLEQMCDNVVSRCTLPIDPLEASQRSARELEQDTSRRLTALTEHLIRKAIVEAWQERAPMQRIQGLELQPHEMAHVTARLRRAEILYPEVPSGALVQAFQVLNNTAPVRLTAGTLRAWSDAARGHLPEDARIQRILGEVEPDWAGFNQAMEVIEGGPERRALSVEISEEEAVDFMRGMTEDLSLGSTTVSTASRTGGADTPNALNWIGRLVGLDLRAGASHTRGESFGAGISAPGAYIEIGTRTDTEGHAKAGVAVGQEVEPGSISRLGVSLGASASVSGAFEHSTFQGLVVRLHRVGALPAVDGKSRAPGIAGDPELALEFAGITEQMCTPLTDEEKGKGFTSKLQVVMAEHPEISVVQMDKGDYKRNERTLTPKAGAAAKIDIGSMKLGAGVGVSGTRTRAILGEQVWHEKQGRTRVIRYIAENVGTVGAAGTLSGAPGMSPALLRSAGADSITPSASAEVARKGTKYLQTLTITDNEIHPTSYDAITHMRAVDFRDAVLQNLDGWATAVLNRRLTTVPPAEKPAPGSADYEALLDRARDSVREYVQWVVENAAPNETFTEWRQMRPAAAGPINQLLATAEVARAAGRNEEADKAESMAIQMARDPAAWTEILLFDLKALSRSEDRGLPTGPFTFNATNKSVTTSVDKIDG